MGLFGVDFEPAWGPTATTKTPKRPPKDRMQPLARRARPTVRSGERQLQRDVAVEQQKLVVYSYANIFLYIYIHIYISREGAIFVNV